MSKVAFLRGEREIKYEKSENDRCDDVRDQKYGINKQHAKLITCNVSVILSIKGQKGDVSLHYGY